MNIETIKLLVIFITLIVATFTDVKKKIIPDKLNAAALLLGIVFWFLGDRKIYYLASIAIAFTLLMILAFATDGKIGGGDIKLLSVLGLYVGLLDWCMMIFISTMIFLFVIIEKMVRRKIKEGVVFAPYILVGYLVTIGIKYLPLLQ